ncbi:cryptochrome/photolyase family protein [Sabulicella rubraurantiaca]|uniref:cryptochrome/photolyase family protein n=1 Tax=Sabulicella rubraurantiaca TaxID=2811429 RepID=UPI001A9580C5|nr:deoxyribodipyrimidine photo-lyase [Sabulicella rubraurantiaca]
MTAPALIWFRQDLRLADHPALEAARRKPILPVFLLDDAAAGAWRAGGAARWWLHHSLVALDASLRARGVALHLARGRAEEVIPALAARIGAKEVHAGRLHEPWARKRDAEVAERLRAEGGELLLHSSALLHDPRTLRSGLGRPYAAFTPFARAIFGKGEPPPPLPVPDKLSGPELPGLALDALELLPSDGPTWWQGMEEAWRPGEAGAQSRLARFMADGLCGYSEGRDRPAIEGTARLSPYLRWGEVSPRQAWHAARAAGAEGDHAFLKELLWRDFSYHLLWHRPEMPEAPLDRRFAAFPAVRDRRLLRLWQRGRTGFPLVDAGMRQLWHIGWMHNRVRMIAASVLVKHLLQPWQDGAAWFWDTLVDADLASNSASWQWVAGSGADASPFFRVFNPVLQGERFDPEGEYIRRWVPELAEVPRRFVHRPWEMPGGPPAPYPAPLVAPEEGRRRALDAFARMRATEAA